MNRLFNLRPFDFFSAFVTPATPRTPAGGRACGTPSPIGSLVFFLRLIRRCARICAVFAAHVRKLYWQLLQQKMPRAGAAGAKRTAREIRGAEHRPSARRRPGHYQGGMAGASNCTNGSYHGPGAAKSAKTRLARGFARGLPDDDPDRDHEPISGRLSIPMVGLVGVGEGTWAWGSGGRRKVGPLRAPTWGKPGITARERPRVSARSL